jgi:hypothetical protein
MYSSLLFIRRRKETPGSNGLEKTLLVRNKFLRFESYENERCFVHDSTWLNQISSQNLVAGLGLSTQKVKLGY